MVAALFTFLIGALVLLAVVYVVRIVMQSMALPAQVQQAVGVAVGIVGLIVLLLLAWQALGGGGVRAWAP